MKILKFVPTRPKAAISPVQSLGVRIQRLEADGVSVLAILRVIAETERARPRKTVNG